MRQSSGILAEIAQKTLERCEEFRASQPVDAMIAQALDLAAMQREFGQGVQGAQAKGEGPTKSPAATSAEISGKNSGFPFLDALKAPGMSFICEVKKASPSKGIIAEDFPYLQIAKDYEAAGASAISCLTEPYWFKGKGKYLQEIAGAVGIPVLRKDFVVDDIMIYRAKLLGASAVLLICSILDDDELASYQQLAEELGMSALVEAHDAQEVERANAVGAKIIGVNNRDLKTFTIDFGNSIRLHELANDDAAFVSESGVKTAEDVETLRNAGIDAVLIGETLMRQADKKAALDKLRGASE